MRLVGVIGFLIFGVLSSLVTIPLFQLDMFLDKMILGLSTAPLQYRSNGINFLLSTSNMNWLGLFRRSNAVCVG